VRIGLACDLDAEIGGLTRIIDSVPAYHIVWVAENGPEAVQKSVDDRPDLVVVKLDLPGKGGAQTTREIVDATACPILILAPAAAQHSGKVFEAMGYGALDVVAAPVVGPGGEVIGGEELLRKIAIIGRLIGERTPAAKLPARPATRSGSEFPLVAIGASTGGPRALAVILSSLPADFPGSVVVVQHVDVQFVAGLAEWLNEQTQLEVELAAEGSHARPGHVVIAASEDHLAMDQNKRFHYVAEPRDYPYRPSIDTLFDSLRRFWHRKDVAVLLTGMGRDGARGLLALRDSGWHTIVQDEKSSTVFGMPKAAVECGAAEEVLPLSLIAGSIIQHAKREKK